MQVIKKSASLMDSLTVEAQLRQYGKVTGYVKKISSI
jgi:hypothetical protein